LLRDGQRLADRLGQDVHPAAPTQRLQERPSPGISSHAVGIHPEMTERHRRTAARSTLRNPCLNPFQPSPIRVGIDREEELGSWRTTSPQGPDSRCCGLTVRSAHVRCHRALQRPGPGCGSASMPMVSRSRARVLFPARCQVRPEPV
jgi:hypothetical protein